MLMLWPVLAIVSTLWRLLVVAPWQLFMGIAHVLYPVVLFCFVAVLCGIVIGGCAGFAAEAVSWFTVTATWGRQVRQKLPAPAIDRYDHDISSVVSYEDHDVDDDDDTDDHDAAGAGEHEHIWDPKGKQPLRRHPGLHTHTASLPEQRFKVQQTIADVDLDKYQNEWVWEEEEEEDIDVFPRRRRWRTSVG
ncbi:hypothetical protein BX666DRAFT_1877846 [Dichotomocladium elegans]|nr:hypothetical protein BX666DRAFT_1877846 [Dichotomocladium elegans]